MLIRVGTPGGKPLAGPVAAPLEKYSITKSGTTLLVDLWYIMKSGDAPRMNRNHQGDAIKIKGTVYPVGLGCKAESRIMYKLNGKGNRFQASVGIDDAYSGTEPGRFRILNEDAFGDRAIFDSGKMTKGMGAMDVDIDVKWLGFILLEFRGKEVIADWVDPRVTSN
jgi:alpha-galactosidase